MGYWLPSVLTVTLIGTMRDNRWNPYGGYEEGYLVVGILVFAAMVFTVVIVAFFPQWMTQAVDESGKYDNLDKKVDVLQVEEEEQQETEVMVKVVSGSVDEEEEEKEDEKKEEKSDADKKYEALVNKKEEIELAEEVNPDKANENQKTDAVE